MEYTEDVLVLRVGSFKEADVWVRFFSPTRGVMTGFAFGGKRSRRRFPGCLDALNRVLFHIKSNRTGSYLCLNEGVLLHAPVRLRQDWKRLGLAMNCLHFVEAVAPDPAGASAAFRCVRETLAVLEQAGQVSPLLPVFFRAALAFSIGYRPRLDACGVCSTERRPPAGPAGTGAGWRFAVESGDVRCPRCQGQSGGLELPLAPPTAQLLADLCTTAPEAWPTQALPYQTRRECAMVVDHFVRYHLGLAWDRGRFHRT